MSRLLLIDLSNNNKSADLARVKAAGFAGLWHKVSEGGGFVDHRWRERSAEGRARGLRVGGYHFARFHSTSSAVTEAQHFVGCLGDLKRRDLAPVLDLEVTETLRGSALVEAARAFNHEVRHLLGIWPLFYSYPSFIESMGASRPLGRGLWLASYGRDDGVEHPYRVPAPFKRALAHQFSSRSRVAGVGGLCDVSSAPRLVPLLAFGWRGL